MLKWNEGSLKKPDRFGPVAEFTFSGGEPSKIPARIPADATGKGMAHLSIRRLRPIFDFGQRLDPDAAVGDLSCVGLCLSDLSAPGSLMNSASTVQPIIRHTIPIRLEASPRGSSRPIEHHWRPEEQISCGGIFAKRPPPAVHKRRMSRIVKGLAARCSKRALARIAKGSGQEIAASVL
jgi:hypothetical protein